MVCYRKKTDVKTINLFFTQVAQVVADLRISVDIRVQYRRGSLVCHD